MTAIFRPRLLHIATWAGMAMWLCGCSSPVPPETETKAPVITASAPDTSPVLPLLKRPLLPPPLPSELSYQDNPQAQALSAELAARFQLEEAWVSSVLAHAKFTPSVARLIMPAASPGAKNWQVYRSRFVEPIRLRKGLAFWQQHQPMLQKAAKEYGVPAEIIASIIGVETIYGEQTGQYRVLDALSTLSLNFPAGRKDRSAFFKTQLGEFLRLCAEQAQDPTQVLGSYAGAMGWPQFMPSSVRSYAVDYDRDGHIDLHNSVADVVGSVAHFLAQHGWQPGMPTHFSVQPPADNADLAFLLGPDILPSFKTEEMQQHGALLDAAAQKHTGLLALVRLENGGSTPSYIAGTENFYVITRYNNSSYYALAVIELAQSILAGQVISLQ